MVAVDKIRGCMAEYHVTQSDLAALLGISRNSTNKKLTNKVDFTISELTKISQLFEKKLAYFLV